MNQLEEAERFRIYKEEMCPSIPVMAKQIHELEDIYRFNQEWVSNNNPIKFSVKGAFLLGLGVFLGFLIF